MLDRQQIAKIAATRRNNKAETTLRQATLRIKSSVQIPPTMHCILLLQLVDAKVAASLAT